MADQRDRDQGLEPIGPMVDYFAREMGQLAGRLMAALSMLVDLEDSYGWNAQSAQAQGTVRYTRLLVASVLRIVAAGRLEQGDDLGMADAIDGALRRLFADQNERTVPDPRRAFDVTAIGAVHRPGWPVDAQTAPGEYFDPFAESIVEIYPEWADGLAGIEEFSHLVVVLYLDRAEPRRPGDPMVHRVEAIDEGPEIGLFATRSPQRPNPIGLSYPRLLGRDGTRLRVSGLDAWPGTPVLDLKGYYLRDELRPDATAPDWLRRLWARHDAERGPRPEHGEHP